MIFLCTKGVVWFPIKVYSTVLTGSVLCVRNDTICCFIFNLNCVIKRSVMKWLLNVAQFVYLVAVANMLLFTWNANHKSKVPHHRILSMLVS